MVINLVFIPWDRKRLGRGPRRKSNNIVTFAERRSGLLAVNPHFNLRVEPHLQLVPAVS